jgi:subfamily B ATP-binding cassette protein MsbA
MAALLWRLLLRPRLAVVAGVVALSILASAIQVVTVSMTIPIIGVLADPGFDLGRLRLPLVQPLLETVGSLDRTPKVLALLGLLIGATLLKACASVWYKSRSMHLLLTTRFALTRTLFDRFLRADHAVFLTRSRGGIAHDIWSPPAQIAEVLRSGTELLSASVQLVGLLAFMGWISWRLTFLCGLAALGGFLLVSRGSQETLRRLSDRTYGLQNTLHATLAEVLDGLRQVRAFAAEGGVLQRFHRAMDEILAIEFRYARLRYLPGPGVELAGLVLAGLLIVAVTAVPSFRLDFAFLVGFLVALQGLHPTLSTLIHSKMGLDGLAKNLEVVDGLLRGVTPERDDGREAPPAPVERLAFERVSFAYPVPGRPPVLEDVSVEFRRGEVTAVVGASGAGKSTLADLIIRLYRPSGGLIRANDIDLRRLDLARWRRSIGFVSQETFLFNASLRENIAFADPEAPFEAVVEAARKANIHEFIQGLPDGYDTVVGDRGLKLSGGQRQRVAIARALLHDPPILVFDEATSALDSVSERAIQETIESLKPGRIVIVIAHRLSTIVNADTIVVLDRGRVVEQGSHADLVGVGGRYAALYAGSDT